MKILLAVDGSVHSRWAEGLLAQVTGPGHSVEVLVVGPVVPTGSSVGAALADGLRKSGQGLVDTVAKSLSPRYKTTGRVLVSHDVAGTLLDRARAIRAELIVLGARGLSPLKQFLLGSVSNKVARHAECSVLIAHRKPSKTLCCVRSTVPPPTVKPRTFCVGWGHPRRHRSRCFTWWPTPWRCGYRKRGSRVDTATWSRTKSPWTPCADGEKPCWRGRGINGPGGFHLLRPFFVKGHPSGEILRVAQSGRFGLVVLGRRGMGRVDRFFMGSVSQKVSSYAPCGVLVVH